MKRRLDSLFILHQELQVVCLGAGVDGTDAAIVENRLERIRPNAPCQGTRLDEVGQLGTLNP